MGSSPNAVGSRHAKYKTNLAKTKTKWSYVRAGTHRSSAGSAVYMYETSFHQLVVSIEQMFTGKLNLTKR